MLRSPVTEELVADVQVPGNSWFSLASATAECESGTCQRVPVAKADRKLNTLLEWSSTLAMGTVQEAKEQPRTPEQLAQLSRLVAPIDFNLSAEVKKLATQRKLKSPPARPIARGDKVALRDTASSLELELKQ